MSGAKTAIIFDFDGTIADSAPIIRAIYTQIALKHHLTVMTDEDYEMLRRGSLSAARKWSGVRFWQFPLLVNSARRLMKLESEKVNLFPGVIAMIRELRKHDVALYVLSLNKTETIARVLTRHGLQDDFLILRRHKRSFGSKAAVINGLVKKEHYDKKQVWMIGDEVRDVKAAKKAGVNSIAVAWGFQDVSVLKLHNPTELVSSVRELHKSLEDKLKKEDTL